MIHQLKTIAAGLLVAMLLVGCNSSSGPTGGQGGGSGKGDGSGDGSGGGQQARLTGKIQRVSRQNNSGTYEYFRETVVGKDREFKQGSMDLSGSKDVVEMVSKTPTAIGYSGMGYATPEVKMLEVSKEPGETPVAPTVENAKSKAYPLSRGLYIYAVGAPEGAIKHYLDWILSAEGQAVVEKMGYVPIDAKPLTDTSAPSDATITIGGSDTMVNLSQAWAEDYMKKYPQVKLEVSGGGSGVGIAGITDGKLMLANCSREMKKEEKAKVAAKNQGELQEILVAYDALAIYVHKDNPLHSISIKDLSEIYGDGGTIEDWSQLK